MNYRKDITGRDNKAYRGPKFPSVRLRSRLQIAYFPTCDCVIRHANRKRVTFVSDWSLRVVRGEEQLIIIAKRLKPDNQSQTIFTVRSFIQSRVTAVLDNLTEHSAHLRCTKVSHVRAISEVNGET